jgi:laminin alpha 3/5
MVLRYKNPNPEPILGSITITPDNPTDIEQNFLVQFKPSHEPTFTTVSGPSGSIPSPLVMNPGHWSVSIKNEKSLFLVSLHVIRHGRL